MAKMVTFTVELLDEDDNTVTREITAKSLAKIPYEVSEVATEDKGRGVVMSLKWGLKDEDLQWFRKLPGDELEKLMEAWEKASQVKLGESPAS